MIFIKRTLLGILLIISMQSNAQLKLIPSGVFHWSELPVKKSIDREKRIIMEGSSPQLVFLEMHATTQYPGATASKAHAQKDIEELIFIKEGRAKIIIDGKSQILPTGSVVLIPPLKMQSIENAGDSPLSYYVMMFRSIKPMDINRSETAGGALVLNADSLTFKPSARGGRVSYFESSTAMCENLEIHITQLNSKGPSHTPHTHIDTEMIIMIEGESEMVINDKTYQASAGDIYLMNSNDMHGISNIKDSPCKYFAIRWR